jgi:RNA polymerase sigma-70 factor (ECF subfamily)
MANNNKSKSKTAYANELAQEAVSDSESLGELYDLFVEQIFAYFFYRTNKSKSTAEDLTSQTFEKVIKHIHKYDSQKGSFGTWLYTIAQNNLTDHYRKHKEEISLETASRDNENNDSTDKELNSQVIDQLKDRNNNNYINVIKNRNLKILNKALAKLPPKDQQVLTLKYLQDLTYKEIGQMIGSTGNAVGVRISRAMKKLKKILVEEDLVKQLDLDY